MAEKKEAEVQPEEQVQPEEKKRFDPMAAPPPETVEEAMKRKADDPYGLFCTSCGNFIPGNTPPEDPLHMVCGACGGVKVWGYRSTVKKTVNEQRQRRGLPPLFD